MWFRLARRKLRLEQRRDVKQVRGRFDGPAFFLRVAGYDRKARFHSHPFEFRIHLVVAEEFFLDRFFSVIRREVRPGTEADLFNFAGELGRLRIAVRDGAGDGIDDDVLGVRVFFGGGGVADAEHVPGALYERVLKASAGAEKWPVVDAGELDAFKHAVEAFVRAARRGPQTIEGIEGGDGSRFEQRRRRKPGRFYCELELPRGVLKRIVGRVMGAELGIEVAENPDPDGFAHREHSKLAV